MIILSENSDYRERNKRRKTPFRERKSVIISAFYKYLKLENSSFFKHVKNLLVSICFLERNSRFLDFFTDFQTSKS